MTMRNGEKTASCVSVRHHRTAIVCIALAAICAICVCLYCMFPNMFHGMFHGNAHPDGPSTTQSSSQTKADFSSADIAELNKAVGSTDGNSVSLAEAHPSYVVGSDGTLKVQPTRSVDELHNSGMYQLTVFCLGNGKLDIDFSIGTAARQQTMQCLTESVNQTSVNLDVDIADTGTVNSTTVITPTSSSKCLIAYRLDYLAA
ncbi:hypothetical protein [Bifidobacterium sp.]|uniref:hypothetical protein n=1 Tax=Bifidobacterium sp. TaxID=41200 RepID=UPI003D7C3B7A